MPSVLEGYHRGIAEARGRQKAADLIRAVATCYVGSTAASVYSDSAALALVVEAERQATTLERSTCPRPVWRQWLRDWGFRTGGPDE